MATREEVEILLASKDEELDGILSLQKRFLEGSPDQKERPADGFVTVHHNLELLRDMNAVTAHVIATADKKVVGYALAMAPSFSTRVPVLQPLVDRVKPLSWQGQAFDSYLIMGQVCVDQPYRGTGIFDKLYHRLQREHSNAFPFLITAIATRNTRSVAAHRRVGFQLLHQFHDPKAGEHWDIVLWDWSDP